MSKSKHTPGPWMQWDLRHQKNGQIRVTSIFSPKEGGADICNVFSRTAECEANASLIAAAPELLKAAQASKQLLVTLYPIFESIDKASTNTDYANGMKAIIGTLKLVIDKAEGRE